MYLDALTVEMVSFIHYVYFYLFAKQAKQSVLTISFDNMINSNIVSYILEYYAPSVSTGIYSLILTPILN